MHNTKPHNAVDDFARDYILEHCGRENFIRYEDLERAFNVPKQTLYNNKAQGKLQPSNPGGFPPYFHLENVIDWLRRTNRTIRF